MNVTLCINHVACHYAHVIFIIKNVTSEKYPYLLIIKSGMNNNEQLTNGQLTMNKLQVLQVPKVLRVPKVPRVNSPSSLGGTE